jgi:hypothetical protein
METMGWGGSKSDRSKGTMTAGGFVRAVHAHEKRRCEEMRDGQETQFGVRLVRGQRLKDNLLPITDRHWQWRLPLKYYKMLLEAS